MVETEVIEAQTEAESEAKSRIEERNLLLKDVDQSIIQRAWFTLAHLLLEEGSLIADMGCGDGEMTYAMAVLEPKLKFVGVDKNKRDINRAKEKYQRHNLEFKTGDVTTEIFEPVSLDAIINSYTLHEVYSGSRYSHKIVSETLAKQFKMLKKGGTMFIRDFSRPAPEEFVLMEMPDVQSEGQELAKLSEADLLVWYSEHARPKQDPGMGGFFLEEIPPRFPGTRLFHLPFKWAYEFIMRKDDRDHWDKELPMEYTFFTPREFRQTLRSLGARVQYCAPHWNDDTIEERFEGKFKLYQPDGKPLGHPPTSYIAVARKMVERKSLHIEERRPSHTEESSLQIRAMRDQKTGEIIDVVSRGFDVHEILPYRIDDDGALKVYLHDGIARSITNAVARGGVSLDRKRWSAHMIEPIAVDGEDMSTIKEFDVKHTVLFARDYLGLKPKNNAILEKGPDYYPAPDFIDERVHTLYLHVEKAKGSITPKSVVGQASRFQAKGEVREFDAQQVLNAISAGMIPDSHLEIQLLTLFQHLNIKAENWSARHITMKAGKVKQKTSLRNLMERLGTESNRFKDIKGTAGQLRPVHSTFVEQGQTKGAMTGLSAQDIDFVVRDDQTPNVAVVLPLTKGLKNDVHAGFTIKHMPVPQRHEGTGASIAAPSFNLPPEVTNVKQAKKFVAEKYGVLPEMVIRLGESYYSHIGVTPQKIYPFAVIVPPEKPEDPDTEFLPFYQFMLLRRSLAKDPHFMLVIARAYRFLHEEIQLDFNHRVKTILKQRFDHIQQDWSLPIDFESSPLAKRSRRQLEARMQEKAYDKDKLDQQIEEKELLKAEKHASEAQYKEDLEALSPDLAKEFEQELEEFVEALESEGLTPQPEKW